MTIRSFLTLCFVTCLGVVTASAASPSVSSILPRGGQQGTEVELDFRGANLTDVEEVLTYGPGLTVKKLEAERNNRVKATVEIAKDCPLGEHVLRLRTATGVSDARTFWVGHLPIVQEEADKNSQFQSPQKIPMNVTVHGVVTSEDVDYYAVECKKGERLSVDIEAMRLATTFFDPAVAILDSKRFEIAENDDDPLVGQDSRCSVIIPEDGTYIIRVRESSYAGDGNSHYRLHVGNFPLPNAVLPAGGKPGEEIEVRFLGDPKGEIKQKVKLPDSEDLNFRLYCKTDEGMSPTGFPFRVIDLPNTTSDSSIEVQTTTAADPAARNQRGRRGGGGRTSTVRTRAPSPDLAVAGPVPGAFNGIVADEGESAYFKFAGKKGQVFDIHCYARRIGSPLDSVLTVRQVGGGTVGSNDDTNGPDSYLRVTLPNDAEYTIEIRDHLLNGGPDYFFRVEVTPVAPETTTNIPRVNGNNVLDQSRQAIVVPKGNRFATVVLVNRSNWGGPAKLDFDKLPKGIKFDVDNIDANMSQVPVVFEADDSAAIAGLLADMQIIPTESNRSIPSRTRLDLNYARALNNTPFHTIYTDRVPVAVADSSPFSIEVVEPKAPVVQNGSLRLKVIAKREKGFDGEITIIPLWTPPGMGIQGSTKIPAGKNEAYLNMNANGNAATRVWKTALLASAGTDQGNVWVSSQLFPVEVAKPYVTLALERAAVEQGQNTDILTKIELNTPFEGKAKIKLLGLPAKAETEDKEIGKDDKELNFAIKTDGSTPVGKHKVFCQVIVPVNGEDVVHTLGSAELRVDKPLPKTTAAKPTNQPKKPEPSKEPEKRLSRLEQLRKEQEAREKAAQEGADK